MVTHATRVAVIGGGLGGLTAAIALTRIAGVQVTVFEQAGELAEVGAGVAVAPNGQRALDHFGLLHEVKLAGAPTDGPGVNLSTDGRVVAETPWSDSAGRYRTFGIHRADFIDVLAGAIPAEAVGWGNGLASFMAWG